MMRIVYFYLVFVLSILNVTSLTASATPITWTLSSVTFDDGGIASGEFTYDRTTLSMSDWSITVSGGDTFTFPEITYSQANSTLLFNLDSEFVWDIGTSPATRRFRLHFNSLNDLGVPGTVALRAGDSGVECKNCLPFRLIIDGGSVSSSTIPEPSTLLLLGSGLVGLGFMWRRASG